MNGLPVRYCSKCGKPFVGYAICPACRKIIDIEYAKMMAKKNNNDKPK